MALPDATLTVLLEILEEDLQGSRITPEQIHNLQDQVKVVSNDLESLKEFFREVSKSPIEYDHARKKLVRQIREIVFEAQDIVDKYVVELAKFRTAHSRRMKHPISDLSSKLSKLTQSIEPVKNAVDTRSSQEGFDRSKNPKKAPVNIMEEQYVVGFEDEAQRVISHLIKGPEELQVISIVGMSGLGKTTLANMVFHNPIIESEFYNRIWVYVSRDCNIKRVFLAILGQITRVTDDMRNMTEEILAKEIYRSFEKEKYLIVMDDVWSQKDWNNLQIAFPKKKKKSRILMTTCFNNVAKHANPKVEPCDLRLLRFDESWTLFQRKIFGSVKCPPTLEVYGKRIVDECDGLPLAIVNIGEILLEKGAEVDDWKEVSENVKGYISHEDGPDTMDWTFYQLPDHLKACLIYIGMFPRSYSISVTKLIRLWIAEGFVELKRGMDLENIAEDYLKDLVNMNLVRIKDIRNSNGKVKTCYVHDTIHEFCKRKACEENFHYEIKQSDQIVTHSSLPSFKLCRSLLIPSNSLNNISLKQFGPNVRSLLCSSSAHSTLPADFKNENISCILEKFILLRVLDGGFLCFPHIFPHDVAQLVNLRYLYLNGYFKTIPKEITRLQKMQTLLVKTPNRTIEIKGDIRKLSQLRHLETHKSTLSAFVVSADPAGSDGEDSSMKNLRTLSFISPESCTEEILGKTPKLIKLGIRGQLAKLFEVIADGHSRFDNVKKLDALENLKMDNVDGHVARIVTSLPDIERFPLNLKKLKISGTQLAWEHMSTLGRLEKLQILKLENDAFKGSRWKTRDGGFAQLQVLVIKMSDLAIWEAYAHHFPKLKSLHLKQCTSLKEVPSDLANIPSLQTMELNHTTSAAATSAKNNKRERGLGFKLSIYPLHHDN